MIVHSRSLPPGAFVITYLEYAQAYVLGRLDQLGWGRPSACPNCKRFNPAGVYLRRRDGLHCLGCAPNDRRCSQCGVTRSLENFRVTKARVESPCSICRRANNRNWYHVAKQIPRERPKRQCCTSCGVVRVSTEFPPDGRYRSGLDPVCLPCKKEQWQAAAGRGRSGRR